MKFLSLAIVLLSFSLSAAADLTVYTDRPKARFLKAAQTYEEQTGEKVVFVEAGFNDIVKRLQDEGASSPANVVITKDAIYLADLVAKNLLAPMQASPALDTVNEFMREPNLKWVGITFRARTAVFSPSRVNASELTTYADLADPKWAGRLCLRSGKAAYNEALVASLIVGQGEAKTREIVKGWLDNLATAVYSDDLLIVEAIANGVCDVGLINHYYLAMSLNSKPNLDVNIAFLGQEGSGVHTNGMGAGLTSANQNPNAQSFIELLLTPENQLEISSQHFDYPAVKNLLPSTFIRDWGTFTMSPLPWSEIGAKASVARDLIREAGYQ